MPTSTQTHSWLSHTLVSVDLLKTRWKFLSTSLKREEEKIPLTIQKALNDIKKENMYLPPSWFGDAIIGLLFWTGCFVKMIIGRLRILSMRANINFRVMRSRIFLDNQKFELKPCVWQCTFCIFWDSNTIWPRLEPQKTSIYNMSPIA